MLKDIHIQNYRGIKDLKIKDFKRINLLVGDNNSGKTSVLEAVTILYPNLVTLIQIIVLRELGFFPLKKDRKSDAIDVTVNLSALDKQFYNRNYREPFEIKASTTSLKFKSVRLEASLSKNYEDFGQIIRSGSELEDQRISEINSFVAKYSSGKVAQKLGFSTNGTGKTIGDSFGSRHIFISEAAPKRDQLFKQFEPIAKSSREKEYVEIMKNFEPDLCDIKQAGDDLIFEKSDKSTVSISYMGTGFVRFLSIFLTIDNLKDEAAVISIDEVGNGLHPSKQELFWQVMFDFLKKHKNVQIFATTHSDESVAALSEVFAKRGKKDLGEDEIRLFKIMKKSSEQIGVLDYDSEMVKYSEKEGINLI